jgi:predicted hotdog family 3-hydroxylacyl-ACP dehydratase
MARETAVLGRSEIEALIPHKGAMCLLDSVLTWDDTSIQLATRTHTARINPLRSAFGLRAVHLCEYGAQAMAVHGALLAQARKSAAQPGMLVALRNVKLCCEYFDQLPHELLVTAACLHAEATLLQYVFRIYHDDKLLAEGRATAVLQGN